MKIGVLMGGNSSEREVSLSSGKAIVNACKKLENEVLFSEYADNYFKWSNDFNGEKFSIEYVDFIELDSRRCKEIRTILKDFKIDQKAKVTYGNAIDKIDNLDRSYDLLFADPPYGYENWDKLLAKIEKFQIMKRGSVAIFETSKYENNKFGSSKLIMETQRKYGDSIISMYLSNG